MFEHTLILGPEGHYETTAARVAAVRTRLTEESSPARYARRRRFEPMQRASIRRARGRKQVMRRHRTVR